MIKEATAMTVRKNLGELINEVQYRHDSILVTKAGKPVAAIVDQFYSRLEARGGRRWDSTSSLIQLLLKD